MNREFHDKVIDALIATAVLPNFLQEPTPEVIARYIEEAESEADTDDDSVAYERVSKLLEAKISGNDKTLADLRAKAILTMAMNRKNAGESFCDETDSGLEIAREAKRQEIIKRRESENDK